jgi:hypothetical protein
VGSLLFQALLCLSVAGFGIGVRRQLYRHFQEGFAAGPIKRPPFSPEGSRAMTWLTIGFFVVAGIALLVAAAV